MALLDQRTPALADPGDVELVPSVRPQLINQLATIDRIETPHAPRLPWTDTAVSAGRRNQTSSFSQGLRVNAYHLCSFTSMPTLVLCSFVHGGRLDVRRTTR